jgi:hypothetical protein
MILFITMVEKAVVEIILKDLSPTFFIELIIMMTKKAVLQAKFPIFLVD